jgi:hypothetical protein
MDERLARAQYALEGLSVGDALSGIVVMYTGIEGILTEWRDQREPLPLIR